jgi:excisionase family DNA binding protein
MVDGRAVRRAGASGRRVSSVFGADSHRVTDRPRVDRRNGDAPVSTVAMLLRPMDVARILGVSRSWLYEAAKDGRIPCVRLGGEDGPLRFLEADLAAWLEQARSGWLPTDRGPRTVRPTRHP